MRFEKGVSVVICTYNGTRSLEPTLQHLSEQNFTVPFEIILVDNASTDGSKSFCDSWWEKNGNSKIAYRSMVQSIPGKTYAQEMGYEEAKYEYLLVVDDDNLLDNKYVQTAYDIMDSDESIGALGGWCDALLEEEKPGWFDQNEKYFAVGKQGVKSGDITNQKGCVYGAGMMLRKSHWKRLYALGFDPLLSCRKGNSLSSGGDTEYCYALRLLGYKIWYDDRLYFKHYMISGRVRRSYISRLRKALSDSNFKLRIYEDEIKNINISRSDFMKEFWASVFKEILPMTFRRVFGNFDQKEYSKEYFRRLKMLWSTYDEYNMNREALRTWLKNVEQK